MNVIGYSHIYAICGVPAASIQIQGGRQWKTREEKNQPVITPLHSQSLLTGSLFLYKFKIFLDSYDFVRGDWWLYFPKDLVFPQNHCQARQCLALLELRGEPGCLVIEATVVCYSVYAAAGRHWSW